MAIERRWGIAFARNRAEALANGRLTAEIVPVYVPPSYEDIVETTTAPGPICRSRRSGLSNLQALDLRVSRDTQFAQSGLYAPDVRRIA